MDPVRALEAARAGGDEPTARAMAARELCVTFLTELIGAMRKTVPDAGLLPRAPSRDVLEGVFDRAMAETMARGDPLGLERRLGAPAEGGTQASPGTLKVLEPTADTDGRQVLPRGPQQRAEGPER
jgi:hypothetical protein